MAGLDLGGAFEGEFAAGVNPACRGDSTRAWNQSLRYTMTSPFHLIDSAELASNPDDRRIALESAIRQLMAMDISSTDVAYALGYSWYLMPDDSEERRAQILRHLGATLRAMPTHLYARLYMAHHYFDTAQFSLALDILRTFGAADFAAKAQEWRDVKVAELILACLIELRDEIQIQSAAQNLLECASSVEADAVPVPVELSKALCRVIQAASKAPRDNVPQ